MSRINKIVEIKGEEGAFVVIQEEKITSLVRRIGMFGMKTSRISELQTIINGVMFNTGMYRVNNDEIFEIEEEVDEILEVLGSVPELSEYMAIIEDKILRLEIKNENLEDMIEGYDEY